MSIDEQPMNVYWSGQKSPTSNKYKINYKGTVATASALPATGNKKGDTYNILEDGSDYIWTGSEWDKLGANVYIGATDTANGIQGLVPPATTVQMYNLLTGMGTWQSTEDLGLALDSDIVHKTGDETITGIKNFQNSVNINAENGNTGFVSVFTDYVCNGTTPSKSKGFWFSFLGKVNDQDTSINVIQGQHSSSGNSFIELRLKPVADPTKDYKIRMYVNNNETIKSFHCETNNLFSLGNSSSRWTEVFAVTGTINTSDEREKESIDAIPDNVLDAWEDVDFVQFNFSDALQKKGENARLHCGLVSQQVARAFSAHGLDASRYGLYCYDQWEAQPKEVDENGNVTMEAKPAGDAYGVRYIEALCVEAAYQRRRAERAEAKIKTLEDRLSALEEKLA